MSLRDLCFESGFPKANLILIVVAIAAMPPALIVAPTGAPLVVVIVASAIASARCRTVWRLLLIDLIGFLVDAIAIAVDSGTLVAVLHSALYRGAAIVITQPPTQARMANVDLINNLNHLVIAAINSCRLCASLLSGSVGKNR